MSNYKSVQKVFGILKKSDNNNDNKNNGTGSSSSRSSRAMDELALALAYLIDGICQYDESSARESLLLIVLEIRSFVMNSAADMSDECKALLIEKLGDIIFMRRRHETKFRRFFIVQAFTKLADIIKVNKEEATGGHESCAECQSKHEKFQHGRDRHDCT
jgi:hypothetical protein